MENNPTNLSLSRKKELSSRLEVLKQRIQKACDLGNRTTKPKLLAVSKTRPATEIDYLYHLGQHAFGENYLQEALNKIYLLSHRNIEWHFIGQIQNNKTKGIAQNFDWVHSVSSIKTAQRLSQQRPTHLSPLNICIQVNIDAEQQKSGVPPAAVLSLAKQMMHLDRIQLRGLMCLPNASATIHEQHLCFNKMQLLLLQLNQQPNFFAAPLDCLSMGMSNDLEIAISNGATLIRIGSDLFGRRNT